MKMTRREAIRNSLVTAATVGAALVLGRMGLMSQANATPAVLHHFPVVKTDAEWHKILTSKQYHILREAGTDPAYSEPYEAKGKGTYKCAACDNPLYSADTQFDSGTGWPSFWQPISKTAVYTQADDSLGMSRDEVVCARCGSHLGHVFNDGPKPTGLRYCMNATAMKFVPNKK